MSDEDDDKKMMYQIDPANDALKKASEGLDDDDDDDDERYGISLLLYQMTYLN